MSQGISLPVGQGRSKYVVLSHGAGRRSLTAFLTAVIVVKQTAFIIVRTFPRVHLRADGSTRFRVAHVPSRITVMCVHAFKRNWKQARLAYAVVAAVFYPSNNLANVQSPCRRIWTIVFFLFLFFFYLFFPRGNRLFLR